MPTITKTLDIALFSLTAAKIPTNTASLDAQRSATQEAASKAAPGTFTPPAQIVEVKPGFQLALDATDTATGAVFGRKLLTLIDGKLSASRTPGELGDAPASLVAAIATLQSEVSALVVSLQASGKLTF
jgi:hypothetical protein